MEDHFSDTLDFYFNKLNDGLAIMELVYNDNKKPVDFIYQDVNKAYELITNIQKNQILGKKYSEVYPEINYQLIERFEKVIVNNKPDSFEHYSKSLDKNYKVYVFPIKQLRFATILTDITDVVKARESNENLSKILNASRLITSLILEEKDADELLNRACQIISNSLNSAFVWISTLNKQSNKTKTLYSSDKELLSKLAIEDKLFPCIEEALRTQEIQVCDNLSEECHICSVQGILQGQFQLTVPIIFNDLKYGVLTVSLLQKSFFDDEKLAFFNDLANDLAYALFNLEVQNDLGIARNRVRKYYMEIDSQNKKLRKLNDEHQLKNEELQKANEKALESEKLKASFLSNVSHELRTPLNGILGFTQLIKQPGHSLENIKEYLDVIHLSGNLLLESINSILDISKIESNQITLNEYDCDVVKIVDDIIQQNKAKISDKKELKLISNTINSSYKINCLCDESKLKQVLNILINNAIKFTDKGEIRVGVGIENKELIFYVKDTGIGIDDKKFKVIFNNFIQVEDTNTRKFGGIGLGLSIAKGLVNLMDGKIWLESKLKKGSTFYFKIPYRVNKNIQEKSKKMDFNKISSLDWSTKKILIVEDDAFSAEYLAEALSITKVNMVFAKNGNEAIKIVREDTEIDLVLMDIQLPDLSGDKATSIIRESNIDIPIIAQTAHAMVNDKESYINAGCTDYISKPIAVNELFSVLSKYI